MNKLIKNLTVAAAISVAIIGVYAPATASANGGSWQRDSVGWWYKNSNGSYPKNDWQRIDGKWYYFDGRGYITHSKWERIKGYWYYFNTSGHMTENTWEMISDKWYYFDTKGHMLHDQWVDDYYVGKNGDMLKNAVTPDNYVVGSDGKWDKRFSRELAEKARLYLNPTGSNISKRTTAELFSQSHKTNYDTVIALMDVLYPNYNYVNNAKLSAKTLMEAIDVKHCGDRHDCVFSKNMLIDHLVYNKFTKEEAEKAINELGSEIDLPKYFQDQAITYLKRLHKYKLSNNQYLSRAAYEDNLTLYRKFTKEEAKKALDIVEINYIDQAQQEAKKILLKETGDSRRNIIYLLVHGGKFTKEEAEKGVDLLNHDFKVNLRRAIEYHCIESDYNKDKGYPNNVWYPWHSKQHLIEVLSDPNGLEGFERSDVEEVIEEYNINYTERAKLRAMDILKNGKYSRSNLEKTLIDQWKFTKEESTNAVKDLKHENLID